MITNDVKFVSSPNGSDHQCIMQLLALNILTLSLGLSPVLGG